MQPRGFVLLAYGVVWAALLVYLFILKNRMRNAEAKLSQLHSTGSPGKDEK